MPSLVCPTTGETVALPGADPQRGQLAEGAIAECPHCGQEHVWYAREDAVLHVLGPGESLPPMPS